VLTRLEFRNFKSWAHVDGMRMAPITGLFGPNSSGKTSILQLLLLLKQTVESTDRAQVLHFGDERSQANLGTFRDVVFQHETDRAVGFKIEWTARDMVRILDPERPRGDSLFSGRQMAFESTIESGDGGALAVSQFEYSLENNAFGLRRTKPQTYEIGARAGAFRFLRALGRKWPLPAPLKFYGFPDQARAYFQNAGFLSELELEFEEVFANTYYLGPLRDHPQRQYTWAGGEPKDVGMRGERVVDALLASRIRGRSNNRGYRRRLITVEEHVAIWLRELGLIHAFQVEPISEDSNLFRVKVQTTPDAPSALITDVGFGVSQILPVLTLCFYVPKGSTVILEQPEIHLHPAVQAGLADVLIEAAIARNIQIIVESHSEHLLSRLQRRIAEGIVQPDQLALYFVSHDNRESHLTELEVDLWGNISNWPDEFFGDALGEATARVQAAARRRPMSS
jgi:predicted ATPase